MCSFRNEQSGRAKQDQESDPFLNSALQRFTYELDYQFGSLLPPLSVGIIKSRHYLSEHSIKNGRTNGGTNGDDRSDEQTAINPE